MLEKKLTIKLAVGIIASLAIVSAGTAIAAPTISGASEIPDSQNQTVSADSLKTIASDIPTKTETSVAPVASKVQAVQASPDEIAVPSEPVPAEEQPVAVVKNTAAIDEPASPIAKVETSVSEQQENVANQEVLADQNPSTEPIQEPPALVTTDIESAPSPIAKDDAPETEKSRWHLVSCEDNGDGTFSKRWESDAVSGEGWSLGTALFEEVVPADDCPYCGFHLVSFEEDGDTVFTIWESDPAPEVNGRSIGTAEFVAFVPASEFFVWK